MTVAAVPYVEQNLSHSAALFRQAFASGWAAGGVCSAGELAVSAQSSPNMSVQVAAGRAIVPGTNVTPPSGFGFTTQGDYFVLNDGTISVTISAANATNPRIDVVYVGVQDQYYSGSTNTALIGVATGTPAPSPTVPAIPNNAVALAQVAVAANATSIVGANITQVAALAASVSSPSQGLTLVNPSSVVNATVSPLGKVSFSAAASVSLNGVFSSAFDHYKIKGRFSQASSTNVPTLLLRAGGVDSSTLNYDEVLDFAASATPGSAVFTGRGSWQLGASVTATDFDLELDIDSPALAQMTMAGGRLVSYVSGAAPLVNTFGGGHRLASAFDGFSLTGVPGVTGNLRVYGYNAG